MTAEEQQRTLTCWLDQHRALVYKVARVYTRTAMDKEDLSQEIVVQIWNSIPAFRGESSVTTWMYRIALNTALKWTRKEINRRESRGTFDKIYYEQETEGPDHDERLTWLYNEIHQLDEIDKSVTLLMLDGFSYKEMASMMGISESNVGVKINRIKKYLISQSKKYQHHGI